MIQDWFFALMSAGGIPANALLEDDEITPLYEDDGTTILLEDI